MSDVVGDNEKESYCREVGQFGFDRNICDCGYDVGRWTSRTPKNPARRLVGCRNFKDPRQHCGFRKWIDPELTHYYKGQMNQLKQQAGKLDSLTDFEQRMGFSALRNMEKDNELKGLKMQVSSMENKAVKLNSVIVHLEEEHSKIKMKYANLKQKCKEAERAKGRDRSQCLVIVCLLIVIITMLVSIEVSIVGRKKMLPF